MVEIGRIFGSGRKYGTGLILSGGGAKGFAHAGMLRALNEAGIYPEILSCVSAGAIVGALYADGYKPDEIYEFFSEGSSFFDYVKITVPKTGLFKTVGLKKNLARHLRAKNFDELKLPLYVAAVNLNKGKVVYFNEGTILDKVQASAAIPVLFEPVEIDGDFYIDGGMLDNFPLEPIREQCKKLIGISLNPVVDEKDFHNLIHIAERTFRLSASVNIGPKFSECDIVIEPRELAEYGMLDVSKGKEMFDLGYRAAKEML